MCIRPLLSRGYFPVTFVADTGAPGALYLSEKATTFLVADGRIRIDETGSNRYIETSDGRKCAVRDPPEIHRPGNIMGLIMLMRLGFGFQFDELHATFSRPLPYL